MSPRIKKQRSLEPARVIADSKQGWKDWMERESKENSSSRNDS